MFSKVFVKNCSFVRIYLTVLVFSFIFVSCSSMNFASANLVSANLNKMKRTGNVSDVILETKDFITMGIIFVTSSVKIENNEIISGSKITFEMLMKEAQKLGADDIVNLRVDEIDTIEDSTDTHTTTYKATALAIKYVPTVRR